MKEHYIYSRNKWKRNIVRIADEIETEKHSIQSAEEEDSQEGTQGRGRSFYRQQDAEAFILWQKRSWQNVQEIKFSFISYMLLLLLHLYRTLLCNIKRNCHLCKCYFQSRLYSRYYIERLIQRRSDTAR